MVETEHSYTQKTGAFMAYFMACALCTCVLLHVGLAEIAIPSLPFGQFVSFTCKLQFLILHINLQY